MKSRFLLYIAILVGAVVGILSAHFALGPVASFIFWGVSGIALGLFVKDKKTIIWSGILYGILLSISFLFSSFGGTADKIAGYSIFILALCPVGALGGILTVFIGSKLRRKS